MQLHSDFYSYCFNTNLTQIKFIYLIKDKAHSIINTIECSSLKVIIPGELLIGMTGNHVFNEREGATET